MTRLPNPPRNVLRIRLNAGRLIISMPRDITAQELSCELIAVVQTVLAACDEGNLNYEMAKLMGVWGKVTATRSSTEKAQEELINKTSRNS